MAKDARVQTLASAGRTGPIEAETRWWQQVQGAQGIADTNGLFLLFLQCLCSNHSILWKLLNCFKEKRGGKRERKKKRHIFMYFSLLPLKSHIERIISMLKSHSRSLEFRWFCLIVLQVYHGPWSSKRNISDALLGRGTCQIWTYCHSSLSSEIPHRRMLSGRKLASGEVKTHTETHTLWKLHTHTLEPN